MQHLFARRASALFIGVMLIAPAAASAQTVSTTDDTQIQALLTQIKSLQDQLRTLIQQKTGQAGSTSSTSDSSADCSFVTKNMKIGARGPEVAKLQSFLSMDPSIFPEATTTGYFGPATERALQRLGKRFASSTATTTDWRSLVRDNCGDITRMARAFGGFASTTGDWTSSTTNPFWRNMASGTPMMPPLRDMMGSTTWMGSTTLPMRAWMGSTTGAIADWMASTSPRQFGNVLRELHSIIPGMFGGQNGQMRPAASTGGTAGAQ